MSNKSRSKRELPMKEKAVTSSRVRALSSKENKGGVEVGETSFRVYYGEIGAAVPFMWESQPGTPKHPIFNDSNDNFVPPLTPPPSFNSSTTSATSYRKTRRARIVSAFISSISSRSCSHVTPTSSLSFSSYSGPLSWSGSSSSSSSVSLYSPTRSGGKIKCKVKRRSHIFSSPQVKKFPIFYDDESDIENDSTNTSSTIGCFGFKKQGCSSIKGMKNAILTPKGR